MQNRVGLGTTCLLLREADRERGQLWSRECWREITFWPGFSKCC